MEATNLTAMADPANPWMMQTGSLYLWPLILVLTGLWALKTKRLPLMLLLLIAGTSCFWQEFFADWGAYLSWNPKFDRLPFWGVMAYTTPVKPLFIPFSWGWWFAVSVTPLVMLTVWLSRKLPKVPLVLLAFLITVPLYSAYELNTEGSAVASSWWSYNMVLGPTFRAANGGNMPIIYPVILAFWAWLMVALLAKKDANGQWWHERKIGVNPATTGWAHEGARLWAFIVLFQVSFLVINTLPPVLIRLAYGAPSVLVP
jgi:hypothetical protein